MAFGFSVVVVVFVGCIGGGVAGGRVVLVDVGRWGCAWVVMVVVFVMRLGLSVIIGVFVGFHDDSFASFVCTVGVLEVVISVIGVIIVPVVVVSVVVVAIVVGAVVIALFMGVWCLR